jgi:hypothetical protein
VNGIETGQKVAVRVLVFREVAVSHVEMTTWVSPRLVVSTFRNLIKSKSLIKRLGSEAQVTGRAGCLKSFCVNLHDSLVLGMKWKLKVT